MDIKKLVEYRREAEKAVADMPDGELKVKAFEVILAHLMEGAAVQKTKSRTVQKASERRSSDEDAPTGSAVGRILVLQNEGFFKNQKTIGEMQEELRAHGWHYPLTTLSGRLQALVQRRKLRRERAKEGNKKIWKYSNP